MAVDKPLFNGPVCFYLLSLIKLNFPALIILESFVSYTRSDHLYIFAQESLKKKKKILVISLQIHLYLNCMHAIIKRNT